MSYIDEKGKIFKYGEFFPYDMCPLDIMKRLHMIFSKNQRGNFKTKLCLARSGSENYNITIPTNNIPDNITDVPNSLLKRLLSRA